MDDADTEPGCPYCGQVMKPLLNSYYCPSDCDKDYNEWVNSDKEWAWSDNKTPKVTDEEVDRWVDEMLNGTYNIGDDGDA